MEIERTPKRCITTIMWRSAAAAARAPQTHSPDRRQGTELRRTVAPVRAPVHARENPWLERGEPFNRRARGGAVRKVVHHFSHRLARRDDLRFHDGRVIGARLS